MRRFLFFPALIGIIPFFVPSALAQRTIENIIVSEFEPPYESITVLIDDDLFDYRITGETEFRDGKKKKSGPGYFSKGCLVNLSYGIENRERVAKTVQLLSNAGAGTENFTGVFEWLEGDVAYIDGRKVRLSPDGVIDCSGKKQCGCSSGMAYLSFSEIRQGDFVTVKGVAGAEGLIAADQAVVCKNEYTDTDRTLRTAVENSFNDDGTYAVPPPTGVVLPPNTLHLGNIQIGSMQYPLLDDIRIQGYVNMVGNRILPEYAKEEAFQKRHDIFFRFYVINNPIPNAFAFPNGMVFVHTGLLQLMENEAQLAAVLGHEIAHVTYEHSSSRYKSLSLFNSPGVRNTGEKVGKFVGKWVKDKVGIEDGSLGDGLLEGAGNALAQTRPSDLSNLFEKSKETQADRAGLLYMYLAGYDVREAATFWQIMSDYAADETFQDKLAKDARNLFNSNAISQNQFSFSSLAEDAAGMVVGNYLETIYTSHPLTQKRLEDINRLLLTTYKGEDFNSALVGGEEYEGFVASIK